MSTANAGTLSDEQRINPRPVAILKALTRRLEDEGSKAVDYARLTFFDLAEFYAAH
jgi:hypothetical protein